MTSKTGSKSSEPIERFQGNCPYIGLIDDPQAHVGSPDNRNYCHLMIPSREVAFSHQQSYCLAQQFPDCAVYLTSGEGEVPDKIFGNADKKRRGINLAALFAFSSRRKSIISTKTYPSTPDNKITLSEDHSDLSNNGMKPSRSNNQLLDPISNPENIEPSNGNSEKVAPEASTTDSTVSVTTAAMGINSSKTADNTVQIIDGDRYSLRLSIYTFLNGLKHVKFTARGLKLVWIILTVAVFLVLLMSGVATYNRYQQMQSATKKNIEDKLLISFATAVREMSVAGDAWGTAAVIENGSVKTDASKVGEPTTETQVLLQNTAEPKSATPVTPISSQAILCQNIADAKLQIVSGPQISPNASTQYRTDMQNPTATWVIQNTGKCSWSQFTLWSVFENTIVQPTIKQDGQLIASFSEDSPMVISPGEKIEVVLEIPALNASNVDEEWVGVVDGLSLITDPHFVLKVENWIVYNNSFSP